jgi:hypothetical protein
MKTINVTLTNEEHAYIMDAKNGMSWHDFMVKCADLLKQEMKDD